MAMQPKFESQCHSQVMCNGELLVSFHKRLYILFLSSLWESCKPQAKSVKDGV